MLAEYASVRVGCQRDAKSLAGVFRESWSFAYTGIIPHTDLSRMIGRRGEDWWRENLRRPRNIIVAEAGGTAAGYATFGPSRVRGQQRGEIYELYVAPTHLGLGLGERLFESARQRLDAMHLAGLIVWALTDNKSACDFYWRRGGRPVARTSERFGARTLAKTGFGWD